MFNREHLFYFYDDQIFGCTTQIMTDYTTAVSLKKRFRCTYLLHILCLGHKQGILSFSPITLGCRSMMFRWAAKAIQFHWVTSTSWLQCDLLKVLIGLPVLPNFLTQGNRNKSFPNFEQPGNVFFSHYKFKKKSSSFCWSQFPLLRQRNKTICQNHKTTCGTVYSQVGTYRI